MQDYLDSLKSSHQQIEGPVAIVDEIVKQKEDVCQPVAYMLDFFANYLELFKEIKKQITRYSYVKEDLEYYVQTYIDLVEEQVKKCI